MLARERPGPATGCQPFSKRRLGRCFAIRKRAVIAAVAVAISSLGGVFASQAAAQSVCVKAKVVVNGQEVVNQEQCLP